MENKYDYEREHWTVDKRVPLALVFAIALQTAGFAYFMGSLSTRLTNVEKVIASREGVPDRLTRVEVLLQNVIAAVSRIEDAVSK